MVETKDTVRSTLERCRSLALKSIEIQQRDLQLWGMLADFDRPILTMQSKSEGNQLRIFASFVEKGLVSRRKLPVHWSPSSQTALAEAELTYDANHQTTAVFAAFPTIATTINQQIHLLIWTTTPWSLFANMAVAINSDLEYVLIHTSKCDGKQYVVAKSCLKFVQQHFDSSVQIVREIPASWILQQSYYNPLECSERQTKGESKPVWEAQFVKPNEGTGLVHVAPAYGKEDFELFSKKSNGNPLLEVVDLKGKLVGDHVPVEMQQKSIQDASVVEFLMKQNLVVSSHQHRHKHPLDWRTNQIVIQMAMPQWFIDIESLKDPLIKSLDKITFHPASGKIRLRNILSDRSHWCISRQRLWGVPLPVFYRDQIDGEVLCDPEVIRHIASLFDQRGSQCWWNTSINELLPLSHRHLANCYTIKGTDTMDVWFDSGCIWSSNDQSKPVSDVIVEGSDQFRGWFQSTLITSMVHRNTPSTKCIISHGFVLDEKNRKMSKSLGNVVDPCKVIEKWGLDVVRLWAVTCNYEKDVVWNELTLKCLQGTIAKLRNTFRFLLGNTLNPMPLTSSSSHVIDYHDTNQNGKTTSAPTVRLQVPIDQWIVQRLKQTEGLVKRHLIDFQFSKAFAEIQSFVQQDLSAQYIDSIRDRLYLSLPYSEERRSIQIVFFLVIRHLNRLLEPFTPLLCAHISDHLDPVNIQLDHIPLNEKAIDQVQHLMQLKDTLIEQKYWDKQHASKVHVQFPEKKFDQLSTKDYIEILNVAHVSFEPFLEKSDNTHPVAVKMLQNHHKCHRCWGHFEEVTESNNLCNDCHHTMLSIQQNHPHISLQKCQ